MSAIADINLPPIEKTIFTDVSSLGWGIYYNSVSNGIRWNTEEQELHINILELIAIFNGLKSFCSNMRKAHIKIMSDNTTAIAYVNPLSAKGSKNCSILMIFGTYTCFHIKLRCSKGNFYWMSGKWFFRTSSYEDTG